MNHEQKRRLLHVFAIINDTHIERDFCPLCELTLNLQKDPFEHSDAKLIGD